MSDTTNSVSKSAKAALKEIESRLRDQGYDEGEIEEVCFAASTKIEERLSMSHENTVFTDIIADFASPELAPEVSEKRYEKQYGANSLGAIALLFSLIIIVLFVTIPFMVGEESGGAAMMILAIIASPVGAILGWYSRNELFGKIALMISALPMAGFILSLMLHVIG